MLIVRWDYDRIHETSFLEVMSGPIMMCLTMIVLKLYSESSGGVSARLKAAVDLLRVRVEVQTSSVMATALYVCDGYFISVTYF